MHSTSIQILQYTYFGGKISRNATLGSHLDPFEKMDQVCRVTSLVLDVVPLTGCTPRALYVFIPFVGN